MAFVKFTAMLGYHPLQTMQTLYAPTDARLRMKRISRWRQTSMLLRVWQQLCAVIAGGC